MRLVALVALAATLAALSSSACSAPSTVKEIATDKAFGERVRAYLLAHPEVLDEAAARLDAQKAAKAAETMRTALSDHRKALEADPRDGVAGNPNGRITIVEFFDYRCPYCKRAAPTIFKYLDAHKDVRLVLKEYPILSEVSEHAAHAALGAKPSGKYVAIHQQMLAESSLDDAAIGRVLTANGLDPAATRKAGEATAVDKHIADVRELGKALAIDGTPTFIIGDKLIPGWIEPEINTAIDELRKKGG